MPETEDEVTADLHRFLNDAAGTYTYAITGLHIYRAKTVQNLGEFKPRADTMLEANSGPLPGKPDGETFQKWSQTEFFDNLDDDGLAARQIGYQWLTFVFHAWDDDHVGFRARIAAARGVEKTEVKMPVMGDLRLMRNDVIHHRGIAQAAWTGRCEQLHWFEPGELIFIGRQMVWEFMREFGLTESPPTGPYQERRAY